MTYKKVDHVAIAVPDLDAGIALYKNILGKGPEHIEEVPDQKVRGAFFAVGETSLELIFPTAAESPVSKFLADRKGRSGLHHICLAVTGIETHLAELKKKGIQLIDEKPRIGANGKKIAFVHPRSTGGVLIELSEMVK